MGEHYRGPGAPVSKQQAKAQADAAERIGNGDQLTPEDWPLLGDAERVALFKANPDKYRQLRDGKAKAGHWRPSVHGATRTRAQVRGADL